MSNTPNTSMRLRKQGIAMIVLLVLQYLLGMATNLFAKFPDTQNVGTLWEYVWSHFYIASHVVVGSLIAITSLLMFVEALLLKDKLWRVLAGVATGATFLAGFAGAQFVETQSEVFSFLMSICFIVAFVTYGWGIYSTKSN